MEMFIKKKPCAKVVDLIRQREIQESNARQVSCKLKVTADLIKRLGLETELKGHKSCVNCLEWNESGSLLASASDDVHVILWDPFRYETKLKLQTGHRGNIFTVKFMPKSNDSILVTGAADHKIRVHDVSVSDTLLVCNCHFARVKRVATAPSIPFLFWSASEDGLIMQYDLRVPHSCKSSEQRNVFVNLSRHTGGYVEAKCISVNPRRPELIAVGASDPYVRMYDRRMIKLSQRPASADSTCMFSGRGDPNDDVPFGCAQYFIAGHLKNRNIFKKFSSTYVTFNDDGNELLVNMGGEQIYLFDINNGNSKNFIVPVELETTGEDQSCIEDKKDASVVLENISALNVTEYSSEVEELQLKANKAFEEERFVNAISFYNEAISLCPYSAKLYGNRAAAYMKRAWDGDTYAALRDCRTTLSLDPEHIKSHFRLARCLFDLNQPLEARNVMENFKNKFPQHANASACKELRKSIKEALNAAKFSSTTKESSSDETLVSDYEKEWRESAIDFKLRLCGHCNTITDIKEANFFGDDAQFIIAGSDDGSFFIWDRYTTNIVRVLKGDKSIVNCLQPHPSTCLLATSGIDSVIRLWSPLHENESVWEVENVNEATMANYIRMNSDHFEEMLLNMGYSFTGSSGNAQDDNEDQQDSANTPTCRLS